MAYFANGTSGDMYQQEHCEQCRNYRDLDDGRGSGCPIWDLHLEYNRDMQFRAILDFFIPMTKDCVYADKCKMFFPKGGE